MLLWSALAGLLDRVSASRVVTGCGSPSCQPKKSLKSGTLHVTVQKTCLQPCPPTEATPSGHERIWLVTTSPCAFKTFADFWFSEDPRPRCEIGRSELLLLRRRSDGCGHCDRCDPPYYEISLPHAVDIVNCDLYNTRPFRPCARFVDPAFAVSTPVLRSPGDSTGRSLHSVGSPCSIVFS
jgi:hypothetical protein